MPFDIEKGYGENETKKSHPHPIVRDNDMVYISPPSDLAELLHLKVFHIPHKKKYGNKQQRRLIGEQYLRGNEEIGIIKKAKAKDVLNAGSSELQTYGHVKLSNLLRKIRKLKVKKFSEQGYQKEVLDRLHQSSVEPRAISAGKPILHGLHDRTLDETIEWAFEYVEENISTISKTIFNVVDELKTYAAWKEKNRLLKAGVAESSINSPRRKVAVIQGSSTDTGPNQLDPSHLPFRRPKNIPLIDQLNRIDMLGFHKFVEAIVGGKPETPQSPRQSSRQTNVWSANNQSHQSHSLHSPHPPQSQQSPRPPITRKLSTSYTSGLNSPRKQTPKLGMAHILQTLDENSIAKPPSSVAGAYGSSTAASSYHPSVRNQRTHSSGNNNKNNLSSPQKNREISTAPSQISNLTSQIPTRPSNSPKTESRPKSSRIQKNQDNKFITMTTTTTTTTTTVHTTTVTVPSRPSSRPPTSSSPSGKRNHRKSVLMSSNGLQQQILTDEDTTLLVKVDRRDSDHQITALNQRWGGSHTNTTITVEEEDDEDDAYIGDDDSDFGSIKYQKGAKTVTYSNAVELLTTEWNSQHLYRYNPEFDANEIQDPRVQAYYRRGVMREDYLKSQQEITSATTTRAEVTTERLVNIWEEFSNVYAQEYRKINLLMDRKDFDRPNFIQTLHECFLMDGDDKKLGQLGKNMMVDLLSMKRRAKHRIYCKKMEELSKATWFITLLTKMREHSRKTFQRIPLSLYKFLSIIQILLMYGWTFTTDLFWQLIEKTIESQDHKEIIVHRAIKAIREYLSIDVETFMNYLEKNDIQPCSELLAQIREIKQGRKRAERALQLKKQVVLGAYSPRDAKYNVKFILANAMNGLNLGNSGKNSINNNNSNNNEGEGEGGAEINNVKDPRRKSVGKRLSVGSLPESNLALIREQSEGIADYGMDDRKGSLLDPINRINFGEYYDKELKEGDNEEEDDDDDDDESQNNNNNHNNHNNHNIGLSPSLSDDLSVEFEPIPEIGAPKKKF